MYPVGSNGASQAILDARCLADALARAEHPRQALMAYEKKRLPMTAEIVRSNRRGGPEGVIDAVEQLAPDGFTDIDKVLSYSQREAIVRGYATKAGFAAVRRCSGSWRPCVGSRNRHRAASGAQVEAEGLRLRGAIHEFEIRTSSRMSPRSSGRRSRRESHAPGGGGRKWMLNSAAIATTSSGFCSFMLWRRPEQVVQPSASATPRTASLRSGRTC